MQILYGDLTRPFSNRNGQLQVTVDSLDTIHEYFKATVPVSKDSEALTYRKSVSHPHIFDLETSVLQTAHATAVRR